MTPRELHDLLTRADSYLSLLWHRYVPADRKDMELRADVERTIADLRRVAKATVTDGPTTTEAKG
jgi:hypothetical protein